MLHSSNTIIFQKMKKIQVVYILEEIHILDRTTLDMVYYKLSYSLTISVR